MSSLLTKMPIYYRPLRRREVSEEDKKVLLKMINESLSKAKNKEINYSEKLFEIFSFMRYADTNETNDTLIEYGIDSDELLANLTTGEIIYTKYCCF